MYGKRRRVQVGSSLVLERHLLPDVWEAPSGAGWVWVGLRTASASRCMGSAGGVQAGFGLVLERRLLPDVWEAPWDADGVVVECAGKYKRRMHARKRALQEEFNVSLSPKALAICALDVNLL